MASSSHVPNVTVTVLLEALATPGAGFGTVTYICPLATNSLNGDRYMDFADYAEAVVAQGAGFISVTTLGACEVAFSQTPSPTTFRVAYVDLVGLENYADALSALEALGLTDLYAFCMDSRIPAVQLVLAAAIEASSNHYLLIVQDDDADWITTGIPAAWSTAAEYTRTTHVLHDTDAEFADVAWAVANLSWDPDENSVGWERQVAGVAEYAAYVTKTQRAFAIANHSAVLGTWGSTDYWIDNGVTLDGRPVYETLSADWFDARVSEAIQTLHQRESAAGRKILVSNAGMTQVMAAIRGVTSLGESIGHFTPGQTKIVPFTITAADRTARRLRLQVQAQVGISARIFDVDAYFSQTPVVA